MKLQIGDIVRYLNDVGGGEVTKILGANLVEILDESGFVLPVKENDLVLVERKETNLQNLVEEVIPQTIEEDDFCDSDEDIEGNDNPHLFVAFVRDPKDSNQFDVYLINDCNYHVMFVLSSLEDSFAKKVASGALEANTKMLVSSFLYNDISKMENLHFQGVLFKNKNYELQNNVDVKISVNPVKFYKPGVFVVNDFFDEDAYVIDFYDASKIVEIEQNKKLQNIDAEQIKDALSQKKDGEGTPGVSEKKDTEEIREIDLHIHELVDDETGMSAAAKLDLQVKTFEKELTKAVADGLEKIVFIHGVGNGILKAKIRGCLDRDYPQYFYQDASFQKYKFGATLVYLKKVYR